MLYSSGQQCNYNLIPLQCTVYSTYIHAYTYINATLNMFHPIIHHFITYENQLHSPHYLKNKPPP